ncbi:MAG: Crp/Fnr family transcriptional regulator [Bacteroidia bacterium]|nr:Crp/Fnr family transcriptional regulator [Bacteroidia bacterium]
MKNLNPIKIKNILYKYCSEEWYPIINNNQVLYSIKKGDKIFAQGEKVNGIYFINDGYVKVVSLFDKNKERILRLAGKGKLLGHRGFATSHYPISAIALTNTTVTFIPNSIFRTLIKSNPTLSIYLIDFLAGEIRESEERMKSLMYSDIKKRIAKILIKLVESFGYDKRTPRKLAYTLSRKDFANMAGTTYETVIRTLAHFQKRKYIKLVGKAILIVNAKELKTISES